MCRPSGDQEDDPPSTLLVRKRLGRPHHQADRRAQWEEFFCGRAQPLASNIPSSAAAVASSDAVSSPCQPCVGEEIMLTRSEFDRCYHALLRTDWPKSSRSYVPGRGFCVGASFRGNKPLMQWPRTRSQLRLTRAANALIAASCPPQFCWTSLQFNKNTVAEPHCDANLGLSFILTCGEFEGGSLCVPARRLCTPPGVRAHAMYIDGRELHYSTPFDGLRFSVVAFVHSSAHSFSKAGIAELVAYGFRPPSFQQHAEGGGFS